MSVTVHIKGVKHSTPEHKAKIEAYRACFRAQVAVPDELNDYFEGVRPFHVSLDADTMEVDVRAAVSGDVEYGQGALVHLDKLPAGVTAIRVYMS